MVGKIVPAARRAGKLLFAGADLVRGVWPGPRILIYHRLAEGRGMEIELPPELFRRQLAWFLEHGEIVGLEAALTRRDRPGSERTFVLSFDDGYDDLFRVAFPALRERRLPFVLYLATEPVETGRPLREGARPLSWDQVDEMLQSGLLTLGAHTHRHPDLRGTDRATVAEELDLSDTLIEQRTGIRPLHFAYPYGYWDPVAEEEVRSRYETAVLGAGRPVVGPLDLHRIHRVPVQRSDGLFFFRRRMWGGLRLEEVVRAGLRGYRHPPPDDHAA